MSATPQTDKALARLKALAEGNGLKPEEIVLLGTDEKILAVQGDMHLTFELERHKTSYPGPLKNTRNVSAARIQKMASEAQVQTVAETMQQKLAANALWIKEAVRHLKAQPGEGWGLESADITLDDQTQLVYVQSNCPSCHAQGTVPCNACAGKGSIPCSFCHATGLEPCINCNGTGVNAQNPGQYCLYCNGATQQSCRQCRGTRQMNCAACRGQAKLICQNCKGEAVFTNEEALIPTVHAAFRILETGDLPSGFRRAISRGGPKSLARGHANVAMLPFEEIDKKTAKIPYRADTPFADMRLRIAGKAMRGSVLGQKGVILDLPPFLDHALEKNVKELEGSPQMKGGLHKALEWKVMKDAFALIQQGRGEARALRGIYAAGLSQDMAVRVVGLVRTLMHEQTKFMRLFSACAALVAVALLSYLALRSGVRAGLASVARPISVFVFDVFFCSGAVLLQSAALRYAAARHLQLSLGPAAAPARLAMRGQKSGAIGMVTAMMAVALYCGLLFLTKAPPGWAAIFTRPFG